MAFAKFEITPANGDYRHPDKWRFRLDEQRTPAWWSAGYEAMCWDAHTQWSAQLYVILDTTTEIKNPFLTIVPNITEEHLQALDRWIDVRDSVGNSVRDSVWYSVRDSVWDFVWAMTGSLFHPSNGEAYKFQDSVDLWNQGMVAVKYNEVWYLYGSKLGDGRCECLYTKPARIEP
jgi:hypothetical protein